MNGFYVSNVQKMSAILTVFSKLDDIRWGKTANYNLINYCRDDLTADEKLLTHWICYIMDRQMPFERIWDIWRRRFKSVAKSGASYTRQIYHWHTLSVLHLQLVSQPHRWAGVFIRRIISERPQRGIARL